MRQHIRANLWLLLSTVLLCSGLYPLVLLCTGQTIFPYQAQGSLLLDRHGKPIGSWLIAQPFHGEEYFQPRPSAVSYNAAASGATNWGASNYLLRDRVARILGPIVCYSQGPQKGQRVGPDIESWFQKDRFQGKPGIVAQWAEKHTALAQNWVKADNLHENYVLEWQKNNSKKIAEWMKQHPSTPDPRPEDLAVLFFADYSRTHPGAWPGIVERTVQPIRKGTDIQGIFFDMWRQEHPKADLEDVPADMVMASGSGLDPHITLKNALYQLNRVARKWAKETQRDAAQIRQEMETLLLEKAEAPLGGLAGVKLIRVLEINLTLRDRYRSNQQATR